MNKKPHPTKLRGNDTKISHSQVQSCSDLYVETNSMVSGNFSRKDQSTVQNNYMQELISKPPQKSKCGGRGIIMKQLLEESKNNKYNDLMKKSRLDFSNANIEQHFQHLRDENAKKLREENEMKWKKMFNSHKHS